MMSFSCKTSHRIAAHIRNTLLSGCSQQWDHAKSPPPFFPHAAVTLQKIMTIFHRNLKRCGCALLCALVLIPVALADMSQYWPLSANNYWNYEVISGAVAAGRTTALPASTRNGITTYALLQDVTGVNSYFSNDASGLLLHGQYVPNGLYIQGHGYASYSLWFSPPIRMAPASGATGNTALSGIASANVSGFGTYTLQYSGSSQVAAPETVSVKAGQFSALKVTTQYTISGIAHGMSISLPTYSTLWLAKGIGPVQQYASTNQGSGSIGLVATNLTPSITPQSGWWWNANEPGRGYFIEVKNGRAYAACYLYDSQGSAVWYAIGPTTYSNNGFSAYLARYNGGQTLLGSYKTPAAPVSAGNVSITFSDATHGTITWPGGSVPITRYDIVPGSLNAAPPSFQPETGWWWNADEGGRGFSIEVQGDNLFIAGFMYDASGNPVWYATGGKMTTPQFYQGTWVQYGNGQPLIGSWSEAKPTNPNVGVALFGFDSFTTGLLQLPDGRLVKLTRFSF